MPLLQLSRNCFTFPPPERALTNPNGLLTFGGDLSVKRLLMAYESGIFPWFSPGEPILWWSPEPRGVLFPEQFHVSHSLRRFHRNSPYRVTLNHAFSRVITTCATDRQEGTWITPEIITAYCCMHEQGYAHSIEVWLGDKLVGGVYGVALGAIFCGESMFSQQTNASKTALLVFCDYFISQGGRLIDCQVLNSHTASLGGTEIPRADYLYMLENWRHDELAPQCWTKKILFAMESG